MMKLLSPALAAALTVFLSSPSCAAHPGQVQTGIASYYHDSLHGNRTASGQIYDKNKLSAAHKTLPLGSRVRVTDKRTGKSVVVHVNDRGPFIKGRIIDLSRRAARELGIIRRGITPVRVEVLSVAGRRGA
ncbi:septal ring lytic transglycosylase RlpA family protein [uncultured Thiohalocapsa sp.]|uniref:septal ring lytic transglycosylase RlpA family protein n=1 Tax=uncultured Thiohalocapsa sp. TaxID=768990 RepID=UPI0025D51B03|nr:septal ring lytic transglycosylase RlpA family protein [uncultured Thiohalocapsa sp.]